MIDYTTLTIVLVIIIAFCIPFVYSHQKKNKEEKRLINEFMAKAKQHQLGIGSYDFWRRSYMIGIDTAKRQLLYVKFQPDVRESLVDLKTIKNVSISREEREIGVDKRKEKIVEKLWLSLENVNPNVSAIQLEFFNAEESLGLMGEPPLVKKWHDVIKGALIAA